MTDWANDEHLKAQLRELWAEGHSTAEIGRMMGHSKNAIVGAAHRLDLPGRPSPIKQWGDREPPPPPARRPPTVTLAALASLAAPMVVPAPTKAAPPFTLARGAPPMSPVPENASLARRPAQPVPSPRMEAPKIEVSRTVKCQWPLWGMGRPTHLFCGAPARLGSSWCVEHHARCYVRVRDRREDQAS